VRPGLASALLSAVLLAACDSGGKDAAATNAVARGYAPVPEGAAPRGTLARLEALALPGPALTPALLRRGRERFETFCTPCHGERGEGDGPVVRRGFPKPPSYHEERLRAAPPAYIVEVITNGRGAMWPYAERVPPLDRWAIAAYVKALQGEADAAARPAATGTARP
jgi:mono/diheme cytochrome c family protein